MIHQPPITKSQDIDSAMPKKVKDNFSITHRRYMMNELWANIIETAVESEHNERKTITIKISTVTVEQLTKGELNIYKSQSNY